jgi:metal-responsive CopG/Arc/MetJ family transcriptional regulator
MNTKVSITLPIEIVRRIDSERSYVGRSKYISLLIERAYSSIDGKDISK